MISVSLSLFFLEIVFLGKMGLMDSLMIENHCECRKNLCFHYPLMPDAH